MHIRWAAALAWALAVVLIAGRARGWQESHQRGDDAHIVVDSMGVASVRHALQWHVVHGPLTKIDLANVPSDAEIDPVVPITAEGGKTLQALAERRDERTVRIVVADSHALMRGDFTFDVGWRFDLVTGGAVTRDASGLRLVLSAPAAHDGLDGARTVLELPPAPNEPRPILLETGVVDDSAVAALKREAKRDVLELFRPHVARGEAATLAVRLDPRALIVPVGPTPREQVKPSASPGPSLARVVAFAGVAATLGMGLGLLVAHKGRAFAAACVAHGARPRGLLPVPEGARATIAGVALAAGVGLQGRGQTAAGAACISIALLAAAVRASSARPRARGPGRWRTIQPEEVFTTAAPADWLDIDSGPGRVAAILYVALAIAAFLAMRCVDAEDAWLGGIDAAVVLPLFLTGRVSQLPPQGIGATARWLARVFPRIRAIADVDVELRARVSLDGASADELRLLVVPRMGIQGVVGLEVGLAWSGTPVGWNATPEVLARVVEGSAAATKLARAIPGSRSLPGRRSEERVLRLRPRNPTPRGTVALVRRLSEALVERRTAPPGSAWTGIEQRADLAGLGHACLVPPCRL